MKTIDLHARSEIDARPGGTAEPAAPIGNTLHQWGVVQQVFHWVVAPAALVQLGLGAYIGGLPHDWPNRPRLIGIHMSVGAAIGLAMILRLAWRSMNPVPVLPDTLTPKQKTLAHLTHRAFYVLLILQPVFGLVLASSRNIQPMAFGIALPMLPVQTDFWRSVGFVGHQVIAAALIWTVLTHIAGAFRHEFILKDNVLRRMTPLKFRPAVTDHAQPPKGIA
jgi:cytochrome b561